MIETKTTSLGIEGLCFGIMKAIVTVSITNVPPKPHTLIGRTFGKGLDHEFKVESPVKRWDLVRTGGALEA